MAAVVSSFVLIGIAKIPQYHSNFIRNVVGNKVVSIYGKINNRLHGGTGFHVKGASGKVYLATNGHICLLADENDQVLVRKKLKNKTIQMYRKVIYRHPNHDLCLVESLPDFNGLELSDNSSVLGEHVILVGHPGLRPVSISRGEIVGQKNISLIYGNNLRKPRFCIGKYFDKKRLNEKLQIEKNLPLEELEALLYLTLTNLDNICIAKNLKSNMFNGISYGGNSGSPVVNFWGDVVGVLYAGSRHVTDSYVVPLHYLKRILRDF